MLASILSLFLLTSTSVLQDHPPAKEELIGSTLNVDILSNPLVDETGHKYGNGFSAENHNPYGMKITIQMTSGSNVKDQLKRGAVTIQPHQTVQLGEIVQNDMTLDWHWYVEWYVEPQ